MNSPEASSRSNILQVAADGPSPVAIGYTQRRKLVPALKSLSADSLMRSPDITADYSAGSPNRHTTNAQLLSGRAFAVLAVFSAVIAVLALLT